MILICAPVLVELVLQDNCIQEVRQAIYSPVGKLHDVKAAKCVAGHIENIPWDCLCNLFEVPGSLCAV